MTFKKIARNSGFLALASFVIAGCDGLLDVEPTEQVGPDVATGSVAGVEALLAGVYNRMQHGDKYGSHIVIVPDVLADNARTADPPSSFQAEFRNAIGAHLGDWSTRYQTINEANFVIASAEALDAPTSITNRIKGEALFLRALNYFDLARIFAYEPGREVNGWDVGVVLRTTPTRTAEDATFRPRASVLETYTQIESDLQEAISLLSEAGRDNVFFATLGAAEALLARVYLYWERWDDAVVHATRAMANTSARLASPGEVAGMFEAAPNPESLFEINYDPATESLWVNICQACYTHPNGTWFSIWPPAELLALLQPEDARWSWYPQTADGIHYNNKWTESRGPNTDNTPVLRYAEILLIRAEAYAESGRENLALGDLSTLRASRGLGPIQASGPALIEAILDERRRELAFEGHRWFDLKRRGMDITKPAHGGNPTVLYTDFRILAPLPSVHVQNNPELVQNPGY